MTKSPPKKDDLRSDCLRSTDVTTSEIYGRIAIAMAITVGGKMLGRTEQWCWSCAFWSAIDCKMYRSQWGRSISTYEITTELSVSH
jgi:hypothetical protein